MVRQLPHEIAQKLRDAGAVLTDEEVAQASRAGGGPSFKIVRLTPEIYERLKDKDGIPTVPQANSWAATGGNVRIPLPGGGEIKTPDDMAAFGLKP